MESPGRVFPYSRKVYTYPAEMQPSTIAASSVSYLSRCRIFYFCIRAEKDPLASPKDHIRTTSPFTFLDNLEVLLLLIRNNTVYILENMHQIRNLLLLCSFAFAHLAWTRHIFSSSSQIALATCPDVSISGSITYNDCTDDDDWFTLDNVVTDPNPPQR
jgi:hypothetical protein